MFTRFGGMSSARIKNELVRGERIRALLIQPRYAPLRLADQVALLAALEAGVLDAAPVEVVAEVRTKLPAHLDACAPQSVAALTGGAPLDDALRETLVAKVRDLVKELQARPAMSERLSDIRAHIVATRQLETVITAMRGVAAARAREAQARLEGVRAYAETLGEAIGAALSLQLGEGAAPIAAQEKRHPGHILLAFCSAQGFVGAFNERVLAAVKKIFAASPAGRTVLYVVGERGATLAEERGLRLAWTTPMAAHVDEMPALADRIAAALYEPLGAESRRASHAHSRRAGRRDGLFDRRTAADPARSVALSCVPPLSPARQSAAGGVDREPRAGICLCRALRGGDLVLRSGERGADAGDDRGAQQCAKIAGGARGPASSPATGGDHGRDHRARAQRARRVTP